MTRNAAHFLLVPELAYSPPNEAIVSAYLEAGYDVDLYAPGGVDTSEYGTRVRSHDVRYERKWILQNLCSMRWRRYAVASGTSENPIGLVGLLARLYRFPHFCLVDEIMSGTYSGDASPSWKALCKRTMRTSQFNIVNDVARIELLRDYASLPSESKVLVYPGCFRQLPPLGSRDEIRHSWNMPLDAFAMCHSGAFNMTCGADWIWQAMSQTESLHMILQPMKMDSLLRSTMDYLPFRRRLYI